MSNKPTMAELLAKQATKQVNINKGQKVTGEVIELRPQEIILDLGTKAEGVLANRDVPTDQLVKIKIGDKLEAYVLYPEGISGQVILTLSSRSNQNKGPNQKFNRFLDAQDRGEVLKGRGVEVNKGGLMVEVAGVRGFVPTSQIAPQFASRIEELVGKDLQLKVVEVDASSNRLVLTQKVMLTPEQKQMLEEMKAGSRVKGTVDSVLSFGVLVKLEGGIFGFVHVSQASWEKLEDTTSLFTNGQEVEAEVLSVDLEAGKVNLSTKSLQEDPFEKLTEKYQPDDVVKGTVVKTTSQGVVVSLGDGIEGLIPTASIEVGITYQPGQALTVLVDKIDVDKRKIFLSPFITSTSGLIYK